MFFNKKEISLEWHILTSSPLFDIEHICPEFERTTVFEIPKSLKCSKLSNNVFGNYICIIFGFVGEVFCFFTFYVLYVLYTLYIVGSHVGGMWLLRVMRRAYSKASERTRRGSMHVLRHNSSRSGLLPFPVIKIMRRDKLASSVKPG